MSSSTEKLKEVKKQYRALRESMLQQGREAFRDASKELFEKHELMESFSWRQFTPYFNDGDECVFRADVDYPVVTLKSDGEFDEERDRYDEPKDEDTSPWAAAWRDVHEFLGVFDDEIFLGIFGNHIEVTVSRAGIDVEEYTSHD